MLAPPPQSREVIRRTVDLVTTDVIVRDNTGAVRRRTSAKGDFEVFEDGVKQELVTFVLTHGGRVINDVGAPPPPVAGRDPAAAAAPGQRRRRAASS